MGSAEPQLQFATADFALNDRGGLDDAVEQDGDAFPDVVAGGDAKTFPRVGIKLNRDGRAAFGSRRVADIDDVARGEDGSAAQDQTAPPFDRGRRRCVVACVWRLFPAEARAGRQGESVQPRLEASQRLREAFIGSWQKEHAMQVRLCFDAAPRHVLFKERYTFG